jgi:hypothetical protein
MPLLDLQKLAVGLSRTWAGYLRDWDRSLRSGNYPETTRYNYLLAAAQLGRYPPFPRSSIGLPMPCVKSRRPERLARHAAVRRQRARRRDWRKCSDLEVRR